MGTQTGLSRLDLRGNHRVQRWLDIEVQSLALDSTGALWVGTVQGLYRLSKVHLNPVPSSDTLGSIQALKAQGNQIWLGGEKGLFVYRTETEEISSVLPGPVRSLALSATEDSLWIGTANQGLFYLDLTTEQAFGPIGDWLTQDVISLCPGPEGSVWIGTAYDGLYQVNHEEVICKFSRENGLPSERRNALCAQW